MAFVDTYVSCADLPTLQAFLSNFVNYIPPKKGWAASTYTDPNGNVVNIPAAGSPTLYYSCIRVNFAMTAPMQAAIAATVSTTYPVNLETTATGSAVVGVFS